MITALRINYNHFLIVLCAVILGACKGEIDVSFQSQGSQAPPVTSFNSLSNGSHNGTQWHVVNEWIENDGTQVFSLPLNNSSTAWTDMSSNVLFYRLEDATKIDGTSLIGGSQNNLRGTVMTGDGGLNKNINGKIANGMMFDGNDYISLGNPPALDIATALTIELWAYCSSDASDLIMIGKNVAGGTELGWSLGRDIATDSFDFRISTTGSNWLGGLSGNDTFNINQWYHVVATYDGSNMRLYINGAEETAGAFPSPQTGAIHISTAETRIGGDANGGVSYFNGTLDEVEIYNSALNLSQIKKHYDFMAPTKYGYFDSDIFDTHLSNASWDKLSWVTDKPYGKEYLNNQLLENIYDFGNIDMANNVALLHLNEASWTGPVNEVIDSSGQSHHGTINNGTTTIADGRFGRAGDFDGTNSVTISDFPPNNNYTVSAWAKRDPSHSDSAAWAGIVSKWNPGAGIEDEWFLGVHNGNFSVWLMDALGGSHAHDTATYFPKGEWVHIAFTYDGVDLKGYMNGGNIFTENINQNLNDGILDILIGRNVSGGFFKGQIDEVAIWYRTLNPTEIKESYLRGATRLKAQVRSCATANCNGETFVGPSASSQNYFSEISNLNNLFPSFDISGSVLPNRYVQYRLFLESDSTSAEVHVKSVGVNAVP